MYVCMYVEATVKQNLIQILYIFRETSHKN